MKRTLTILTVILIIQLGVGAGIYYTGQSSAQNQGDQQLVDVDLQQVSEILISSGDANLQLKKESSGWVFPDFQELPVASAKINELLNKILRIKRSWPVAKSEASYERFSVADDHFERKLVLRHGDTDLVTLLLGSSPGFRKVHARIAGENEVFDIPFSTYEASLKRSDWLDKQHFQVDTKRVEGVEFPSFALVQNGAKLQPADLRDGEQVNGEKVSKLVEDLARLQIRDVAIDKSIDTMTTIPVSLTLTSGKTISYKFAKSEKDDYALLRANDSGPVYEIAPTLWNEISNLKRADFIAPQIVSKKTQAAPAAEDTN